MKSFKVNSVLLLICMGFILASCMTPDPGNTQGENALKEKISQESKIPVTISNFTKTNGIKREVMGQPIYTMEFSTQIQIGQECGFLGNSVFLKGFLPMDEFKSYYSIYYAQYEKTIIYEGALIGYDGEITFEKTEKGWRSTDCKLKNFKIINNKNVNSTVQIPTKKVNVENVTLLTISEIFGIYTGISESAGTTIIINSDGNAEFVTNEATYKCKASIEKTEEKEYEWIQRKVPTKLKRDFKITGNTVMFMTLNDRTKKMGYILLKTENSMILWGGGDAFFEKK